MLDPGRSRATVANSHRHREPLFSTLVSNLWHRVTSGDSRGIMGSYSIVFWWWHGYLTSEYQAGLKEILAHKEGNEKLKNQGGLEFKTVRWKRNQQNQDVSDFFSETKETLLEKKDKLSDNLHTNVDVLNEGVKGRMQAGVPGGASSSQWLLSASESSDTDFAPFSLTAASSSVDQKVNWRSRLRFTATDSDAHVQVSCELKWLEPRQKTDSHLWCFNSQQQTTNT